MARALLPAARARRPHESRRMPALTETTHMADEKNPNGGNGDGTGRTNGKSGKVGLVERVTSGVKQDIQALKTDIPTKAKEQIEGLKDPTKTQVYTSIFRHKHDDTPRNRALGVLSNVFLHLHPAKINRDAVRYSYTWGMGGITFYLFIILTYTGVLLMFYYHPSKVQAFRDVLYLEPNLTGTSAYCFWYSLCFYRSPDICCPTINSVSGRSRWVRIWRAPLRCWGMKAPSGQCLE